MTICDGPLHEVISIVRSDFGWACEPVDPKVALVSSGRTYADSEPVEIYVAVHEDMLILSDGGELLNRLKDGGFDLEDEVHAALWRDTLREFRLGLEDGKILLTTTTKNAPSNLARMADALIGLDTLRLIALPAVKRPRTFANAVEDYLREKFSDDKVTNQPNVPLGDDIVIRPTFRVIAKRGPVYIQAAAATSPIQSYDHAFVTFAMAERGEVPLDQRLVVLGGSLKTWSLPRLRVLSERAHVALWEPRGPLDAFLDGNITKRTLLIDQTMIWSAGTPRSNR